jgi:ferredoxin
MDIAKRIVLRFPRRLVDRPIVYRLIKDHDLEFNILKAQVTPDEEGLMVLELRGGKEDYEAGVAYLGEAGVSIQPLSQDVIRNELRCNDCGACITICPTDAFVVDKETRRVDFLNDKCIACGKCIQACPPRAMELHF